MSETNNIDNSELNLGLNEATGQLNDTARTLGFIIGFFGIYFLVISLFSIIAFTVLHNSTAGPESMPEKDLYSLIITLASTFISLSAMFIGYKLIRRLDIGRILFNILTLVSIIISIAQYTYSQNLIAKSFANMPPELAAAARGSESAASQLVFILPAVLVLLAIILNWGNMIAWLKR